MEPVKLQVVPKLQESMNPWPYDDFKLLEFGRIINEARKKDVMVGYVDHPEFQAWYSDTELQLAIPGLNSDYQVIQSVMLVAGRTIEDDLDINEIEVKVSASFHGKPKWVASEIREIPLGMYVSYRIVDCLS